MPAISTFFDADDGCRYYDSHPDCLSLAKWAAERLDTDGRAELALWLVENGPAADGVDDYPVPVPMGVEEEIPF